MLQTLFHIPAEIYGFPVFGFGLLLAGWTAFSVILLLWLGLRQGFNRDTWSYVPLLILVGATIWFILPQLCDEEGLPIRGYGVMLLVGVASAVALAAWRAHRLGIDPEIIFALAFWAFVPGIIGARLFYVVEYWSDFKELTTAQTLAGIVNVAKGGLVVYGSLVGGIAGMGVFIIRNRLPVLATFDLIAPSLALGLSIGRIGCLFNGCCYGGMCDLPWAVTFPSGSPVYLRQVEEGRLFLQGLKISAGPNGIPLIERVEPGSLAEQQGVKSGKRLTSINGREIPTVRAARNEFMHSHESGKTIAITVEGDNKVYRWPIVGEPRSKPVHPTQIYASINSLLLFLFLLAYDPFRRRDGVLSAWLLTLYPVTRILLEVIRVDEPSVLNTGFTPAQNISLILLACGGALWIYVLRQPPATAFPTWRTCASNG
jgi:phosphatidylglycerol:prolipoprotein diacylglycerol transferase